jgi:hypothetical protein
MTYLHCEFCGCDIFETEEIEAKMCIECQKENEVNNG